MCCRSVDRGMSAAKDIKARNPNALLEVMSLDLSSLSSVRRFAKELKQKEPKIDILINNAGVMMCPKQNTVDGFEMQLATNHLGINLICARLFKLYDITVSGHFLLTLLLIENMKSSSDARIITVSSMHGMRGQIYFSDICLDKNYSPLEAYCQSKLANILFTRELAKRLSKKWPNIKAYVLHPGTIRSDLFRHLTGVTAIIYKTIGYIFNIDSDLGCQTTIFCAADEKLRYETGLYYSNCSRDDWLLEEAKDDRSALRLWQMTERMVDLESKYKI